MGNFGSFSDLSSLFNKLKTSLGKRPKTWTGTRAEWDEMTLEQKAEYDGWYVNFTDDAEEGGGGAGGGHIIEDSEGTELTQRDTLQVGGSLIAEDDSTNEKTIITDGMQTIDWEDWLEMTDEEKAAVPKALITNVPGLDSKLNVQFMNKLWENPNPTSAFAAQNITLSSDDYDFLLIEAKRIKSDTSYFSEIVEKGKSIYLSASFGQSGGATNYFRVITYSSDTSLYVDNGYKVTGATASTSDNDCVIPYKIYGFKASVDVDITAYMADLKTDAKNVYLESGESVEDAITQSDRTLTIKETVYSGNPEASSTVQLSKNISGYKMALIKTSRARTYVDLSLFNVMSDIPYSCSFSMSGTYNDSIEGQLTPTALLVSNKQLAGWSSSTTEVIVFK